eukprot:11209749-Lingulodinium_polyedra.AAC.1
MPGASPATWRLVSCWSAARLAAPPRCSALLLAVAFSLRVVWWALPPSTRCLRLPGARGFAAGG